MIFVMTSRKRLPFGLRRHCRIIVAGESANASIPHTTRAHTSSSWLVINQDKNEAIMQTMQDTIGRSENRLRPSVDVSEGRQQTADREWDSQG